MKIGRNAKTGRFTTVAIARRRKNTHIVENIKRATKRKKRKRRKK